MINHDKFTRSKQYKQNIKQTYIISFYFVDRTTSWGWLTTARALTSSSWNYALGIVTFGNRGPDLAAVLSPVFQTPYLWDSACDPQNILEIE